MLPCSASDHKRTLAALALVTCALAPATALARPIDDASLPTHATRDQPPAARADLPTPVVTRNTPSAGSNSDTLPLVLSGAALLVALGGVGLTVRRRQPAPDPDASRHDGSALSVISR